MENLSGERRHEARGDFGDANIWKMTLFCGRENRKKKIRHPGCLESTGVLQVREENAQAFYRPRYTTNRTEMKKSGHGGFKSQLARPFACSILELLCYFFGDNFINQDHLGHLTDKKLHQTRE
jgi:hypothetical protein